MADDLQKIEEFKRAIAAAYRAISHKAGGDQAIEIAFSQKKPSTAEDKGGLSDLARPILPFPPAQLSKSSIDLVRGAADQKALRLCYHDPALYQKTAPLASSSAKAAFEGLEKARCDALGAVGSHAMRGVRLNLRSVLRYKSRQENYGEAEDKEEA